MHTASWASVVVPGQGLAVQPVKVHEAQTCIIPESFASAVAEAHGDGIIFCSFQDSTSVIKPLERVSL